MSKYGVANADYNINATKIKRQMEMVIKSGSSNGIHKSISDEGFDDELKYFEDTITVNRYHFLAFDPHSDFKKMEDAGIKFDGSLSFAEVGGFRNSYGLPYQPYLFSERRAAWMIECSLNIMDTTYSHYLKMDIPKQK